MLQRLHLGLRRAVDEGTLTTEQYRRVLELSREKRALWQSWAALLIGGVFVITTLLLETKHLWWAFGPVTRTVLVALCAFFFWRGTLWFHKRSETAAVSICAIATVLTAPLAVHFLWLLVASNDTGQGAFDLLYRMYFDRPDFHGMVISAVAATVAYGLLIKTSQPLMALTCGLASWQCGLALCFMAGLIGWHNSWIATALIGFFYLLKGWGMARYLRSRPGLAPLWVDTGLSMTMLLGSFLLWNALFSRLFMAKEPLVLVGQLLFNVLFAFWGASMISIFLTLLGAGGSLLALQKLLALYLSAHLSAWLIIALGGLLVLWAVWNLRTRKPS